MPSARAGFDDFRQRQLDAARLANGCVLIESQRWSREKSRIALSADRELPGLDPGASMARDGLRVKPGLTGPQ
jgi:hypothetical protein